MALHESLKTKTFLWQSYLLTLNIDINGLSLLGDFLLLFSAQAIKLDFYFNKIKLVSHISYYSLF